MNRNDAIFFEKIASGNLYEAVDYITDKDLEKVAAIGGNNMASALLGGLGGSILGGLGGAAGHYLNSELRANTMGGVDPTIADEIRANKGSLMQAALSGAISGGLVGLGGGPLSGGMEGYEGLGALIGAGLGGLTGVVAGAAMPSPGEMARDYKAERINHLGIPSSDVNVYNVQG